MAFLLLSCVADSPGPVGPEPEPQGAPVAVAAVSGAGQTGATGGSLGGALLVRVTDAGGRGVRGVAVAWTVSPGGGTLSTASTPTDSAGEARTQWTLGTAAGTHTVTASVSGLPAATFTATAVPPQPAKLEAAGGDGQSAAAGSPLADSLAVKVSYADGRPAPGVAVAWAATGGGGAVSAASTTTGADGVARVRWMLGAAAGENIAQASVAGLAGSPVTFRATARAGGASTLSRVGGDGQSATVGTALPSPLAVRVADAGGNPVAGASVTWMVTAGGGSVTPAIATTDAEGVARAAWTLGTTAGANAATAAAAGATAGFAATGTPGPAARVERAGGDGQSAPAGSALPAPLVVRVADAHGNAVEGATVSWAATAGGGSLSPASSRTDAAGRASAAWTLGAAAGANAATATVAGAGSAAFAATGTPRAAPTLVRVRGDGQAGTVGAALGEPLRVRLADGEGKPVQGATVAWSVTAGGGSVSPAATTTDAAGEAATSWTLGPAPGANAAAASVAGVGTVAFGAEARAGTGAVGGVAKEVGDGQTGTAGAKLPLAAMVRVTDAAGSPLPGAAVSWAVTGGGGGIGTRAETTGADGRAYAEWILGPTAGPQTLTATSGGFSATFNATALAPGAGGLARLGGDGQTAPIGTRLPQDVRIRVTDAAGNPRGGVRVDWTVTGGGGSLDASTYYSTWPDGTASAGWVLGTAPGPQTLTASAGGETLTFGATATPTTFTLAPAEGDDQDGTAGAQLARPIGLRLTDGDGRPVAGAVVSWQMQGGGHLMPQSQATGADGVVRGQWRLGGESSRQSVTGSALGASGTVTAVAVDVAATLAVASGNGQAAPELTALPAPLVVRAANARGNPVAGVKVAWEVSHGGGSVTPASSTTAADGTAGASWTLGAGLGSQSVTARAGTALASFSATARAGAVATVAKTSGDGYTGEAGLPVQTTVLLVARDTRGNPVEGAAVAWTASSGGRLETGTSTETRSDGTAGAVWRLGPGTGMQTLAAAVGGISVTYTVTAVAGHPHRLTAVSGNGQSAQVGTALPAELVVLAEDQFGNRVPGADVRWFPRTGDAGTVTPASTRTAADGTARATWTLGAAPGTFGAFAGVGIGGLPSADFTATALAAPPVPVASVVVSPAASGVEVGKTVQLTAATADAAGSPLAGRPVAWSSASPGIATVSASGVVTGVAPGSAAITATSEGKSGSATVTVKTAPDATAPELRAFSFSPASVDVGSAAAPVEFTFTAADAGSGLTYASVQVFTPGNVPGPYCFAGPGPEAPAAQGTWKCTAPVPRGSPPGTWYVHSIRVNDAAGNQRVYEQAELRAAGFPTTLQVASAAPDTDAPVVAGLAFAPTSVDVGAGPAPVEFTVRLTDAGSGARELYVRLVGPAAGHQQSCFATSPASGSRTDGAWKCTVTIPSGAAPGEWHVGEIRVEDVVLNRRTYTRAMLQAAGLPTAVTVAGPAADATPPALTGFAIAPATVNVSGGAQTVEFTATATDVGTGYARLDVTLVQPGVIGRTCVGQALAGGSPQNGTMKCSVSIPGTVAAGTQHVEWITLYDGAGNQRTYTRAELRAAGFPTEVAVTR